MPTTSEQAVINTPPVQLPGFLPSVASCTCCTLTQPHHTTHNSLSFSTKGQTRMHALTRTHAYAAHAGGNSSVVLLPMEG